MKITLTGKLLKQMIIQKVPIERQSLPTRGLKSSTKIWLDEKAQRDGQLWKADNPQLSQYWIVENKCYDLNDFAKRHPGGQSWIKLTKGQDITQHFMVHHLDEEKARQTLKKYYKKDCPNSVTRFSFNADGFYRTVKRKVISKFSKQQLQDSTPSKNMAQILLTFWFVSLFVTAYTGSYISATICSLLLVGIIGIGHNFVHHKQNIYRYCILLTGFTHNEWQIMHCLSHHIYPNTELDYEAAAIEPIAYFLRSRPTNSKYTELILQPIFIFLQPILMILKIIVVPLIKKSKPDILFGFPILIIAFFYAFSHDIFEALKLYLFIYCLFGFLFTKILFCGHRLQQLWTEGSQKIQDFGQHTVLSTSDSDTSVTGIFSYLLFAGFNIHIAHHFFPTADHSKLQRIMYIIQQTCRQRGIKYSNKNRWSCLKSISRGIANRIPFTRK